MPTYAQLEKENKRLKQYLKILFVGLLLCLLASISMVSYRYEHSSGFYVPGVDVFVVKSHDTVYSASFTMFHELGHMVYYTYLNESQRQDWEQISAAPYVTPYAQTNPSEDFAESFAVSFACQHDPYILQSITPTKAAFFAEHYPYLTRKR